MKDYFQYYFDNAKEHLSQSHTIKNVHFNRTDRGDLYLMIIYNLNHTEGKRVDLSNQFVSIFYNNESELNQIKNYFNI